MIETIIARLIIVYPKPVSNRSVFGLVCRIPFYFTCSPIFEVITLAKKLARVHLSYKRVKCKYDVQEKRVSNNPP